MTRKYGAGPLLVARFTYRSVSTFSGEIARVRVHDLLWLMSCSALCGESRSPLAFSYDPKHTWRHEIQPS